MKNRLWMSLKTVALVVCSSSCFNAYAQANWEPTKSVEFIVPAGSGGGADQMARFPSRRDYQAQAHAPSSGGG